MNLGMVSWLLAASLVALVQGVTIESKASILGQSRVEAVADGRKKVLGGLGVLAWKTKGDEVEWSLEYPTKAGWLGIGTSTDLKMAPNGKAVVGSVENGQAGVSAYNLNNYLKSSFTEANDLAFSNEKYEVLGEKVVLSFTAPKTSIPLDKTVLVARGGRADLSFHGFGDPYKQVLPNLDALPDAPAPAADAPATDAPAPATDAPAPATDAPADAPAFAAGSGAVLNGKGALSWSSNDGGNTITWKLSYPLGQGWLGLGSSADGKMVPGKAVLGLSSGVGVYDLTSKAFDASGIVLDNAGTGQLSGATFSAARGLMTLEFTAPSSLLNLQSKIICAFGSSSELAYHDGRQPGINALTLPAAPVIAPAFTPGSGSVLDGQGDLSWTSTDNGNTITWKLTYPLSQGWLGLGTSANGRMVPGKAVIGLESGVAVYDLTSKNFDASGIVKNNGETGQLKDASFTTNGGTMTLQFTAPKSLMSLESKLISAFGSTPELSYHTGRQPNINALELGGPPPPTASPPDVESAGPPPGGISVLGGQASIKFTVVEDKVQVECTAAQSQGWIACGISPTGNMVGGRVVIGLDTAANGNAPAVGEYILTATSEAGVQLQAGANNLQDASFTKANGLLTLKYTASNIAGTNMDVAGSSDNFILAKGNGNTLAYHQTSRVIVQGVNYALGSGVQVALADNTNFIIAHACLMLVSFLYFMPLAASASVVRKQLPGKTTWWIIHRPWQMFNVAMGLAAFGLAIYIVQNQADPTHFSVVHEQLGLALVICMFLQPVLAITLRHGKYRPPWRVSHLLFAIFIFAGGIANCWLGLELPIFAGQDENVQNGIRYAIYVGTAVAAIVIVMVCVNQTFWYIDYFNGKIPANPHAAHDIKDEEESTPPTEEPQNLAQA